MPAHPHLGYFNPVVDTDWPDPGVFYDADSATWYSYATNANGKNIQCASTTDFCSWRIHDQCALPGPHPAWTGRPGFFWAPEVIKAPGGRPGYLMYVTCHETASDKQCIGVAYSPSSPLGPFHFVSQGPIVSYPQTGGCLDPYPFHDPVSQRRYLIFKADVSHMRGPGPQIWIQELAEDGLHFAAERQPLLAPTQPWQTCLLEAPCLVYHAPSGTYILFFSSGTFSENDYKCGYAISRNLLGPYNTFQWPLLETDVLRGIIAPGGQSVVQGVEGHWFIAFHAHNERECRGGRRMCVHRIEFGQQDGIPRLPGRPCYRRRLRLGAEQEDGIPDGAPHHEPHRPHGSNPYAHPQHIPPKHNPPRERAPDAFGGAGLLGGLLGLGAGAHHKKKDKHHKRRGSGSSDSSKSSSNSSGSRKREDPLGDVLGGILSATKV